MGENRSTLPDRGFLALAATPSLIVFVVPMFVDKHAKMPVVYLGVGLSAVLLSIGLFFLHRDRGQQRVSMKISTMIAAAPLVGATAVIGVQWFFYFVGRLFSG